MQSHLFDADLSRQQQILLSFPDVTTALTLRTKVWQAHRNRGFFYKLALHYFPFQELGTVTLRI